jgi:hypothetical protein
MTNKSRYRRHPRSGWRQRSRRNKRCGVTLYFSGYAVYQDLDYQTTLLSPQGIADRFPQPGLWELALSLCCATKTYSKCQTSQAYSARSASTGSTDAARLAGM